MLLALREQLEHSDIKMTQRYAHNDVDLIRQRINSNPEFTSLRIAVGL
ncbi:MAG TPA: integrase [Spirochaetia bacterium]|nr:integrase [Spirochaetia bacterium]